MGHALSPSPGAALPRIVVLDADPALGSGSIAPVSGLERLADLGELTAYETTPPDQTVERLGGASIAITNKVPLGAAEFDRLPDLRFVSVLATGVNVVDLGAARAHGIQVSNVPLYSTASTAQHTVALLLELTSHVGLHAAHVREGGWSRSAAFSYFVQPLVELEGLTLGVVGYGAIGQRVASICHALGMRVLIHTRTPRPDAPFPSVDKETLLSQSDVLTLHCPLTGHTRHFVDATALGLMKPSALLVNCARGPIVDEVALADALHRGRLGGAALDVLSREPPPPDHPLLHAPRCLITPHIAWASVAARERLARATVENVAAYLAGRPQNLVT